MEDKSRHADILKIGIQKEKKIKGGKNTYGNNKIK